MEQQEKVDDEIKWIDLAPAIEFACWTVVLLAPILRLVNGAAVTDDQWRIQVFLFASALVSAILLRIYLFINRRSAK